MKQVYKSLLIFFISTILVFGGCKEGNAISVAFQDISQVGSTVSQVKVIYQEEKDYKGKLTDILIKTSEDETNLTFTIESGETYNFNLTIADTYYSITKLISDLKLENANFTSYEDAVSKTFIISSNKDCTLTFVAVVAETSAGENLVDSFEVSKPFPVDVKQKVD